MRDALVVSWRVGLDASKECSHVHFNMMGKVASVTVAAAGAK